MSPSYLPVLSFIQVCLYNIPSTKPLDAAQNKTGTPSNCQLLSIEEQISLDLITSLLTFFKNSC